MQIKTLTFTLLRKCTAGYLCEKEEKQKTEQTR